MSALLAAAVITPSQTADARTLSGLFGAVTGPLRSILGGLGGFRHRRHGDHRHPRPGRSPFQDQNIGGARPSEPSRAVDGKPYWPGAYGYLLGYAFASDANADQFWRHGYQDIVASLSRPSRPQPPRPSQASDTGADTTGSVIARNCVETVNQDGVVPLQLMEQGVSLNDAQRRALDHVRAAIATATMELKAICPNSVPSTPAARLAAVERELWAVWEARVLVRAPLKHFYDTLTAEQKTALDAHPPAVQGARETVGSAAQPPQSVAACGDPRSAVSAWPPDHVIARINLTREQRPSLEAVRKTSAAMAGLVQASCPREPPGDLLTRFDAANDRIRSMLYASLVTDQALQRFLQSLSPQQRDRFNALMSGGSNS